MCPRMFNCRNLKIALFALEIDIVVHRGSVGDVDGEQSKQGRLAAGLSLFMMFVCSKVSLEWKGRR